jgi:hypothetical protein
MVTLALLAALTAPPESTNPFGGLTAIGGPLAMVGGCVVGAGAELAAIEDDAFRAAGIGAMAVGGTAIVVGVGLVVVDVANGAE